MDDLVKSGAEARAHGFSEIDNPFYAAEKMPAYTGESPDAWAKKVESWHAGWKIEDAIRST